MEKYSMRNLAVDVLNESNEPLSAQEIWEKASSAGLTEKVGYNGKTEPYLNLYNTLNSDIKNNPSTPFAKVSKNPALFILKERKSAVTSEAIEEKIEQIEKNQGQENLAFNESDLHPILAMFVYESSHFNCRVKTIAQQKSKRQKAKDNSEKVIDSWLYPDLIGVYYPFDDYKNTTSSLLNTLKLSAIKFFSFELKKKLSPSNLRMHYFQAVSNSSWAHEGYLVAAEISDDPDFMKELSLLTNAFGIGVIRLDIDSPQDSEILIPSKFKEKLDYDVLDKLIDRSPDVEALFKDVNDSVKVGTIVNTTTYDRVLTEDMFKNETAKLNGIKGISGRKK